MLRHSLTTHKASKKMYFTVCVGLKFHAKINVPKENVQYLSIIIVCTFTPVPITLNRTVSRGIAWLLLELCTSVDGNWNLPHFYSIISWRSIASANCLLHFYYGVFSQFPIRRDCDVNSVHVHLFIIIYEINGITDKEDSWIVFGVDTSCV